jgi:hypothetical protein
MSRQLNSSLKGLKEAIQSLDNKESVIISKGVDDLVKPKVREPCIVLDASGRV